MNKLIHSAQSYKDGACTIDQFYGQFLNPQLLRMVETWIMPEAQKAGGVDKLTNAYWDLWSPMTQAYVEKPLLREAFPFPGMKPGHSYAWSLNLNICILKTAVRRLDACPNL